MNVGNVINGITKQLLGGAISGNAAAGIASNLGPINGNANIQARF